MIEKDALLGVVSGVCGEFFVPHMGTHGNNSDSFMYETGKRLAAKADQGLISIVLYLGDLDPSGDDMSRDVQERLSRYARREIEVRRLALNPDQVRRYNLPPFEASDDDTRTDGYQRKYGSKDSWELDALPPPVLIGMIRTELNGLIDHKRWKRAKAQERRNSELMHDVGNNWAKVEKMFKRR